MPTQVRDFGMQDITNLGLVSARTGVSLLNFAATLNVYVATTGSDTANTGLTIGSPFATIQNAVNYVAANLRPGICQINIADGTYTENNISVGPNMGVGNDLTYGNSMIYFLGNSATPTNVVIQNSIAIGANSAGFIIKGCIIPVKFEGMDINTTHASGGGVVGDDARIFFKNVLSSNALTFFFSIARGRVVFEASTAGMTFTQPGTGAGPNISIGTNGICVISTSMTLSAHNNSCFSMGNGSFLSVGSVNMTINGTAGVTNAGFALIGNASCSSSANWTFNNINASQSSGQVPGACFRILENASFFQAGGKTLTFNNCNLPMVIGAGGNYAENAANTWVYAGGTPAEVHVSPTGSVESANSCGGATIKQGGSRLAANRWGGDYRYQDYVTGHQYGALPVGATNYLTPYAVNSTEVPLLILRDDSEISELFVRTETANGAAHSDVYTVRKNGADTTFTVTITNGQTGTFTGTPVAFAAGDRLSISVVSDAATTAANVTAIATLRKTTSVAA